MEMGRRSVTRFARKRYRSQMVPAKRHTRLSSSIYENVFAIRNNISLFFAASRSSQLQTVHNPRRHPQHHRDHLPRSADVGHFRVWRPTPERDCGRAKGLRHTRAVFWTDRGQIRKRFAQTPGRPVVSALLR